MRYQREMGRSGEDRPYRSYRGPEGSTGYDAGYRGRRRRGFDRRAAGPNRYQGDYWWLGEREMDRRGQSGSYDEAYRRFDHLAHPHYSPIGGMQAGVGSGPLPRRRPLRDSTRFSDWTRWF
ncbi:MAG: hypothetical protein WD737_06040 [Gemmatimonadota bacterium]